MEIEVEVKGTIDDKHIEILGDYFIEKMLQDLKKKKEIEEK